MDGQSQLLLTNRPHNILLQIIIGHLVLCDVQQRAVIKGSHQGLVVFLEEGNQHSARSLLYDPLEAVGQCAVHFDARI